MNLEDYKFHYEGCVKGVLKIENRSIDFYIDPGACETIWTIESICEELEDFNIIDEEYFSRYDPHFNITEDVKKLLPFKEYSVDVADLIKEGFDITINTEIKREMNI